MSEMKSKPSENNWLHLAENVTKESDREQLILAIEELCGALDQRRAEKEFKTIPQKESQKTQSAKKSA